MIHLALEQKTLVCKVTNNCVDHVQIVFQLLGATFGTQGRGFVRLNFATSPAILREIVSRIARVVQ